MNSDQATIQFISFQVQESHISFNEIGEYNISINFLPSGKILTEINQFILTIKVNISDTENKFNIELQTVSIFTYPENADLEEYKNSYFIINAPAIVFPYIRAYIGTLTAISGMPTLTLPTLNLISIGETLKANIL